MSGFQQALLGSGGGTGALDCLVQREASPEIPMPQAVVVQLEMASEPLQHESPTLPLDFVRVAAIRALCPVVRPSAVVRFVRAIAINPVKALARWASTHVCDEVLKAITPEITHDDATSPVVLIPRIVSVVASALGVRPSVILFRPRHAVRTSPFAGDLAPQTPTASRLSVSKAFTRNLLLHATRAVTKPIRAAPVAVGAPVYATGRSANDRQTSKPAASQISAFHTPNIACFMYARGGG